MKNTLNDKVVFITGSSRGIGREIALRAARDGAKIVIAAKSKNEQQHLPGTIYSVAKEVEAAGGQALPIPLDVQDESMIADAIMQTNAVFGGIDILVNNASAINLSSTEEMTMKRFDLLHSVNMRATFMCSKYCIPYLKCSANPHILTLSPPINLQEKWFEKHLAYTISKYGMSMCTLGLSAELRQYGIAVNSLWPKTIIATAAILNNFPNDIYERSRHPSIVADAAYIILTRKSSELSGQFLIDEAVLADSGVSDFSRYALNSSESLLTDLYIDE